MKFKKIILIPVILLVILIGVNIISNTRKNLDQPIFLEHHYELSVRGDYEMSFDLKYITNKADTRSVKDVKLLGLENSGIAFDVEGSGNISEHGYYKLESVVINQKTDLKMFHDVVANKAEITFSDGRKMTVDIGEIRFYREPDSKNLVYWALGGNAPNGTHYDSYKVLEDCKLTNLSYSAEDHVSDILKLSVNGQDKSSYPVQLKKDGRVDFYNKFDIPKDDVRRFNAYTIMAQASLESINGEQDIIPLLNVNYTPLFADDDIEEFLKMKKAI